MSIRFSLGLLNGRMETGLVTTEAVLRDEAAQCNAVSFAKMGRGSWATRLYPKTGQPVYTRHRGTASLSVIGRCTRHPAACNVSVIGRVDLT